MRDFTEIETQSDLDALLEQSQWFHDFTVKELHLSNRAYDTENGTVMNHRLDARLLLQSSPVPGSVELLFIRIDRVSLEAPGDLDSASGFLEEGKRRTITLTFEGQGEIVAERLFWRLRREWTGPRARFGEEVPHPGCVAATHVSCGVR